jgi:hypothetical protein
VESNASKKNKDFTDLQEITLHFNLTLFNKENKEASMHYCQLKISRWVIQMLAVTAGHVPTTFNEALKAIQARDAAVS